MAELGRITVNQVDIVEVDADPSTVGNGIPAPVGSVAILNVVTDNTVYGSWQKIGPNDTDWKTMNPGKKTGIVNPGDFSGNPKTATVLFDVPFPNTDFAVQISGTNDSRSWTYEIVSMDSFIIHANANSPLTGVVSWTAELVQETS